MKLFGKRQWILSIIGLTVGLILTGYILKAKYGEINILTIGVTGIIGFLIVIIISIYSNK